ncbi:SpaH/EbpB family LPXTG-anchored major pilin [Bifidobacterium longum]|uniref:Isopeptide-forming domain-containing fimbrial protein n=1 Tax=Bifidobacterium longum subsp. longum TaxID=1679 RepID=A0A9Q8QTS6_BIFLL|nr:SpaH/EbpB family LPXTG-anchored major pilin [Bifidobacterium longum]UNL64777.1 isopeptide-forming domain-containing fimbrial protein [Bifidobacterium longum subsp. longum]UNL67010.1 isopeptide-forming domain-containing fimbrial protein [Bifidobacterium longum subsp. longum]UNL68590.1 isopeptide-forming domain-containing fimbrial protein [Bifidobacterium longum subsp. longum]UNL71846.1 isopeptide-forming domain-containing fimbrial protein [Bifidobacterium longum subsp. longum]UNL81055.1 isop
MKLRKLFAGVAAAATLLGGMAFGAATANAADTDQATITVNNAQAGYTYKGYKFATFDNVQGTAPNATSVEVNTVAAWKDAVYNAADAANGDAAVPAEYAENPAAYVATFDAATARRFTDELTKHIPAGEQGTAAVNGVITATEGWFLVTSTTEEKAGKSALVATQITSGGETYTKITLDTEDGHHNIDTLGQFNAKDENAPTPPTKTADGKGTVNVGDTVNYTITAVVPPAAAGYDTYKYTITDAASKGLNVAEDNANFTVVVKKGNADDTDKTLAKDTDYTLTQNGSASDENGTVTTIAFPNVKDYAGKTIQVTYQGVVTSDAVDQVTNTATVENNNNQTGEGTPVVKKLGKFDFTKIGVDNDATGLAGAEFKVSADNGKTFIKFSQDANGVYYPDATNGRETLTSADGNGAQKTLGKVAVRGLAEGDYTVQETKAPTGYAENFKVTFTVTIGKDGEGTLAADKLQQVNTTNKTVLNVKSITQLPLTGAAGTMLFTVVAVLLAGVAATVFAKSRFTKRALNA